MAADGKAPIIIKRKKVIVGGHHGGAWKVAYADFVTAMMAFFLLMWLLGATNENQRKGIADYFNPTIPVNRVSGGGDGAFGGESIFSEDTLAQNGTGAGMTYPTERNAARGDTGADPADDDNGKSAEEELDDIAAALAGQGGESMVSELLQRHVVTRLSDEGLIVEIFDLPDAPLFEGDSDPTPSLELLAATVAEVFQLVENDIAIEGHTASVPRALIDNPVWERSAARANMVRKSLIDAGLPAARMRRVTGYADNRPAVRDLLAHRNNRIEIILLRHKI